MRRFLIWGGGGHGKVVADLIRAVGDQVSGFVDADAAKLGRIVEPGGGRVTLGEAEFLRGLGEEGRLPSGIEAVAIAVGDNTRRLRCLAALGSLPVPSLVHPSATVSPSATIGRGTVVFAGAIINAAAVIGDAVIVNTGAIVEHDCRVGDGAHLSPRAVLGGAATVGSRSWIGAGATIIHLIDVGADTIVGAGAVVIRNVADGVAVAGVPAKQIERQRE